MYRNWLYRKNVPRVDSQPFRSRANSLPGANVRLGASFRIVQGSSCQQEMWIEPVTIKVMSFCCTVLFSKENLKQRNLQLCYLIPYLRNQPMMLC